MDRSGESTRPQRTIDINGAKPSDLPVQLPIKFEMVVNRKTATALGLAIPPSILLRADEIIE
jgi:putative ABC transport system substrate-binding protein